MQSGTCVVFFLLLISALHTVDSFLLDERSLKCRRCQAAAKPGSCFDSIRCFGHENCYTQKYTLANNTMGYRLGCINKDICSFLPKASNDSYCYSCCNDDDCNKNICVSDICPSPYYGPFCVDVCGHCANGEQCEKDTGKCPNGCESGFAPPFCHEACPSPWYGSNCEKLCGNCANAERCDIADGACANGCVPGYVPPRCNSATTNGYSTITTDTAISTTPTLETSTTEITTPPGDCSYIRNNMNINTSGRYLISVNGHKAEVWCDMTTEESGWIVFQRRINGTVPFDRTWREYKNGFGDLSGEFWWGNDHLAEFTANGSNVLRIELEEATGRRTYAEYKDFRVENENTNFRLHVGRYSGTAGDSMSSHNLTMFSTKDSDHDAVSGSCSVENGHGGWWFTNCYYAYLNGIYLQPGTLDPSGISWRGDLLALQRVEMKFRSS